MNISDLEGEEIKGQNVNRKERGDRKTDKEPMCVLFIQRTQGGDLIKRMRKVENRISGMAGDSVRIVERAGISLESLLINKDPWSGDRCTNGECIVCRGAEGSACVKKGVVYQHICKLCKGVGKKAYYWGQTSRSLIERAEEHDKQLENGHKGSHAFKHLEDWHQEELIEEENNKERLKLFEWKVYK